MRRSPLVLTATVAGTAGILAFHAQSPAVRSATAPAVAAPSSSATKSSGSSASVSGTATGDAIDTQYGPAQVRVTVTNGKIVKVEALQLQGNDPRSQQISSSAEP